MKLPCLPNLGSSHFLSFKLIMSCEILCICALYLQYIYIEIDMADFSMKKDKTCSKLLAVKRHISKETH